MDTFLNLPVWLAVPLGVLYGLIWMAFFVVIYNTRHRNQHHAGEMGIQNEDRSEKVSVIRGDASVETSYQENSVYDEDDD